MSGKKHDSHQAGQPPLIIADPADGQMHAGTFGKTDAKIARRLAKRFKCHIVIGDDEALHDLAARVHPGRVEDGRLMLATVTEEVAAELRRFMEPMPLDEDGHDAAVDFGEDLPAMTRDLGEADRDGLGSLSADEVASLVGFDDGDAGITDIGRSDQEGSASTETVLASHSTAERTHAADEVLNLRGFEVGGASVEKTGAALVASGAANAPDTSTDYTQTAGPSNRSAHAGEAPSSGEDAWDGKPAPDLWDALAIGDTVLAADLDRKGEPECWYEAMIVRITPASFILRFRDFPRDGLLARTRRHVALLHAAP